MRPKSYSEMLRESFGVNSSHIRDIVDHPGEKGRLIEHITIDLLQRFTPKRFSIGTGFVIDRDGWISSQIDIIIYDHFSGFPFLFTDSVGLFPIETVAAVVEVKSTYTKKGLKNWLDVYRDIRLRKKNKRFFSATSTREVVPTKFLAPRGYFVCAATKTSNSAIEESVTHETRKRNTHLHGALVIDRNLFIRQIPRADSTEGFAWKSYDQSALEAFLVFYSNDLLSMPMHYTDLSAYFPLSKPRDIRLPADSVQMAQEPD